MKNTGPFFLFTGILLLFSIVTFLSFSPVSESDFPVSSVVDQAIKDEMIKQELVGLAVGVVQNGNIIHLKGYGYSNKDKKTKVSTSTVFRWASVSKPLTAIAAFNLIDDRKLSLESKVSDKVSYWSSSGNKGKLKVKHLLSNRGGVNHYDSYTQSKYKSSNKSFNAEECVAVFKDADLLFTPGSKYEYSTFGFNLLGAVVEEASPSGYLKYIEEKVKKPLGGLPSLKTSRSTRTGYRKFCNGTIETKSIGSVEWKLPGGGWESNISDMAKFAKGLLDGTIMDDPSRLWTDVSGNDKYGYGINHTGSSNLRVWHSGAHDNVRSMLYLYPNDNIGIVILSNCEYTDVFRLTHHIADALGKTWNDPTNSTNSCAEDVSCSGKFAAIWRKTNKEVLIRRGYTHAGFYDEWKNLRASGYYCDDFEPYIESGKVRWDGIFRKGSGGNAMWRGYDYNGFKKKWDEQSKKGYRLIDLETYVEGGKRKWAGLFRQMAGKYAMYRGQSTDEFGDKWKDLGDKGYKLIDIEAYTDGGKLNWAGVWIAGKDGKLNRNYSTGDFGDLVETRRKDGWRLIDLEAYTVRGNRKWAGIWEKTSQGDYLNRGYNYCDLMKKHNEREPKGYELLDLERY